MRWNSSWVSLRPGLLVLFMLGVNGRTSALTAGAPATAPATAVEESPSTEAPVQAAATSPGESLQPAAAGGETPAERGYRWLTTKAFQPDDYTADVFENLWTVWPEDQKAQAEAADAATRRKMSFSRYGLVEAPGRQGGPPLGAVDTGTGWAMNCLACHGGKVAGVAVPGLGNSHYAFQTLFQDVTKYRLARGDRLSSTDATGVMVPLGRSNGTTNAQVFSVVLCAMRDDALAFRPGRPTPRFTNHDLDAPPLWNTHKKHHLYIDGYVAKSSRAIMQFLMVPANSNQDIQSWEPEFQDVLAWIESLEPPKYPFAVNTALADQGRGAFEQHCARCHGVPGPGGEYPELTVDIEEVGTDPVRHTGMPIEHRLFMRSSWLGHNGQANIVEHPAGYVAPPLDGVWASAPYFHNGSVPTLWHVLHSTERPVVWQRSEDGYDQARVGLEISTFEALPAEAKRPEEKRRYFDTSLAGKSAQGHTFPDALSEAEKHAVLEYLKTL